MAEIPEGVKAQLVADRLDTYVRFMDRTRAVESNPAISAKWDTLRGLTVELIGLYHDRIPVVQNAAPHSTGKFMIPSERTLSHALLKKG